MRVAACGDSPGGNGIQIRTTTNAAANEIADATATATPVRLVGALTVIGPRDRTECRPPPAGTA